MWSFWICDSESGEKLVRVEPSDGSFSRVLNGSGRASAAFVLADDDAGRPHVLRDSSLTTPWSRSLVRCWNDVPIDANFIEAAPYKVTTDTLTLDLVDMRTFLTESRFPFGVTSYWADEPNHIPGSLTISSKSLAAAAAKVVEQGLLGPSSIYDLPIVLPSTSTAGSFSNTYYNYNFQTVGDILVDLQKLGLDVDFEPRWSSSGTLEYLMRADSPGLVGDMYEFNQAVDEPRLFDVSYTVSGVRQITGQLSVGEGFEVDLRVGGSGLGEAATIPARDVVETFKSESSEPLLAAYAAAAVADNTEPIEQWEMSLLASEQPGLEYLRLGSILRMFWDGNHVIPDGVHDVRLISFSGDLTDRIVLDVQPWEVS